MPRVIVAHICLKLESLFIQTYFHEMIVMTIMIYSSEKVYIVILRSRNKSVLTRYKLYHLESLTRYLLKTVRQNYVLTLWALTVAVNATF